MSWVGRVEGRRRWNTIPKHGRLNEDDQYVAKKEMEWYDDEVEVLSPYQGRLDLREVRRISRKNIGASLRTTQAVAEMSKIIQSNKTAKWS